MERNGININIADFNEQIFSLSETRLPADIKQLMLLARYFSIISEVAMPAIHMASQLPVTKLSYSGAGEKQINNWKTLLEDKLGIRRKIIDYSYTTNTIGNAMTSISFIPNRTFICDKCHATINSSAEISKRKILKNKITGVCPKCGKSSTFTIHDNNSRNPNSIRIIDWAPTNMDIQNYQLIGEKEYFYHISNVDRHRILSADAKYLDSLQKVFIDAVSGNRTIYIEKDNFFHFYTFMVNGLYDGWGIPRIISALKIIYHLSIIMKANEAISLGKLNDLTILYPESSNATADPIGALGPNNWIKNIYNILDAYSKNKSFVGVSPVPFGYQSIFGNGRAEMMVGEVELYYRAIATVMGIPYDILFSSAPYTSLVASARIVTNQLSLARRQINSYLTFLVQRISKYIDKKAEFPSTIKVELEDYKTPDTIQELAMLANMATPGPYRKISDTTILERFGLNYSDEIAKMEEDEKARKKYVKELKMDEVISQYFADKASQAYQQMLAKVIRPGDVEGLNNNPSEEEKQEKSDSIITRMAKRLINLPDSERLQAMDIIYRNSPEVAHLVEQKINSQVSGQAFGQINTEANKIPIPKQQPTLKPPRQ